MEYAVRRYADAVATRLAEMLGERLVGIWLVGIWLVGSAALGDHDPRRSDVDLQAVATGRLPVAERRLLAQELDHRRLPNPARELELVLYAAHDLTDPVGPRFQLNLNTGARMTHHVGLDADAEPRFWFTLDVAIARQRATPLLGPDPAGVFPALPARLVAAAQLDALDWFTRRAGATPDGPVAAVLTACRAWAWATDGCFRSKGEAAEWAMSRLADATPIRRALGLRDGRPGPQLTVADAGPVADQARAALVAVAGRW